MIPAHDSPLAALAFDASGTKLATASEKVGELRYSTELLFKWFIRVLFGAQVQNDPCRWCFPAQCDLFVSIPPRAQ